MEFNEAIVQAMHEKSQRTFQSLLKAYNEASQDGQTLSATGKGKARKFVLDPQVVAELKKTERGQRIFRLFVRAYTQAAQAAQPDEPKKKPTKRSSTRVSTRRDD